jgi:hypothetical protein
VVQKRNFRSLPAIVALAHSLGVHHVSFLAADVMTDAFGRKAAGQAAIDPSVALDASEALEFRRLIEEMTLTCADEFRQGFIAQSPEAMFHIAGYFAALQGLAPFPRNICNARCMQIVRLHASCLPRFRTPRSILSRMDEKSHQASAGFRCF